MYESGGETYCCEWTIRWQCELEPFVRDGESSGFGRFVGLANGIASVQLWFVPGGIKIEHAQGYFVQIDIQRREINIIQKG